MSDKIYDLIRQCEDEKIKNMEHILNELYFCDKVNFNYDFFNLQYIIDVRFKFNNKHYKLKISENEMLNYPLIEKKIEQFKNELVKVVR